MRAFLYGMFGAAVIAWGFYYIHLKKVMVQMDRENQALLKADAAAADYIRESLARLKREKKLRDDIEEMDKRAKLELERALRPDH